MDAELFHICEEVDIGKKNRERLVRQSIKDFRSLKSVKDKLEKGNVEEVSPSAQTDLHDVCDWFDFFKKTKKREPDIRKDFIEEALKEFRNERGKQGFLEHYLGCTIGSQYSEENEQIFMKVEKTDNYKEEAIQMCLNKVMTPYLKEQCGKFEYEDFIRKMFLQYHNNVKDDKLSKIFIVAGRTQSGKSSIKGIVQSMSGILKIPTIVLTKGVPESRELHQKLKQLAKGTAIEDCVVCCSTTRGMNRAHKAIQIRSALLQGGTLVVADTKPQINKAIRHLEELMQGKGKDIKFTIVVDECDTFYRTRDKKQQLEKAYKSLMDMKPALTVMVSATPIPMILGLLAEDVEKNIDFNMFNIEPIDDYMGLNQIQPLKVEGKEMFLELNDLKRKSTFAYKKPESGEGEEEKIAIPYMNDSVKSLYDDALSEPDRKKGVLVLDCTNPYVNTPCNVFEKAELLQDMYLGQHKQIIVITYTGLGVKVKFPDEGWQEKGKEQICNVIEDIDNDKDYGLETPIFIFGFTKMRRGISYRSSKRVPTHFVMSLGRCHNVSNMVQTMGRATFNGKSILESNGFSDVTILTTSSDLTTARKLYKYMDEVYHRHKQGSIVVEAFRGANQEMPDTANFLRHTFRELGQCKGQRKEFKDLVAFAGPPKELSEDEKKIKDKYWMNLEAQKLLRTILKLSASHPLIVPDDLFHAYTEEFEIRTSITKIKKWLNEFSDNAILTKDKTVIEKLEQRGYEINSKERLHQFVNKSFFETDYETGQENDEDDTITEISSLSNPSFECREKNGQNEVVNEISPSPLKSPQNAPRRGRINTRRLDLDISSQLSCGTMVDDGTVETRVVSEQDTSGRSQGRPRKKTRQCGYDEHVQ